MPSGRLARRHVNAAVEDALKPMSIVYKWTWLRLFKTTAAGAVLVGMEIWGVAVRDGGLSRNIPSGRRPSHAVVAGCRAAVEVT